MIRSVFSTDIFYKISPAVIIILCSLSVLNPFEALSLDKIPPGGDSRAHIYRISGFLDEYVVNKGLSLRQYNGMVLLSYAPLFYAILYPLSIFSNSIYAYKIGRVIACITYLAAIYLLSRRISIDRRLAILIIPIAAFFPTLWFIYYNAAYPYLFSWSLTLFSITLLLMFIESYRFEKLVASAFTSGLSILAHSYGLINIILPITLLVLLNKRIKGLKHIVLLLTYLFIAFSVSSIYIYSVLLTINDVSPLYELSPGIKIPGLDIDPVSLFMTALSLYIVFKIHYSKNKLIGKEVILCGLLFFTILSLASIVRLTVDIYGYSLLNKIISLLIPWRFLYVNNASFITLYVVSRERIKSIVIKKESIAILIAILVITATIISVLYTSIVAPYEKPIDYALPGFTDIVKNSRVLVLGTPLTLPNSPVSFTIMYNYTTSTGSYNQGDPAFFDLTVYYEWMNTLVKNPVFLENIVELTRSKYILTDSDLTARFKPLNTSFLNTSKCILENNALQKQGYYNVLCLFEKQLVLNKFSGIMIRFKNIEKTEYRVWVIHDNGVEEELELLNNILENNSRHTIVFQLPYSKTRGDRIVKGVKISIYFGESTREYLILDSLEIAIGHINIVRIISYEYRGHKLNLYEYYREPSLVLASEIIVFNENRDLAQVITLLASEGYRSVFVTDGSIINYNDSTINHIAGIVTSSVERAEDYVKKGFRTVLITYGEKFNVKNKTSFFAHVETPLVNQCILPRDLGNLLTYSKWDKEVDLGSLLRCSEEASKLWYFIREFMNITIDTPESIIRYNPPEVRVEHIENRAVLVKVAYTSMWYSNTEISRSNTGFIIVLPKNNVSEIEIKWNPVFIDIVFIYNTVFIALVSLYLVSRLYTSIREIFVFKNKMLRRG